MMRIAIRSIESCIATQRKPHRKPRMSPLLLVLCFVASTAAAACPYGYLKDDVSFECFPCSSVCKQGDHLYPRCKDQCDKVTIAPGSKTTAATLQTTQATTPATTPDNRQYLSRSPDASRRTDTRRIDEDEIVTTAVLASIFGVIGMVVMVATAVWCCRKRRKNNHRSYTGFLCDTLGCKKRPNKPVTCTDDTDDSPDETMV